MDQELQPRRHVTSSLPVLVVDDDPVICRVVARLLKRERLEADVIVHPEVVPDGKRYGVGLIDLHLGGASGVSLAKRLLSEGIVARVFFFTGGLFDGDEELIEGVGSVVPKDDVRRLGAFIRGLSPGAAT